MKEFCNSVVNGLVGGIATAIVWAAMIWIINAIRINIVERGLREDLSRIGASYGDYGFGITIKNDTDYPPIVRDVTRLTDQADHGLGLLFTEPLAGFLIQEKKMKMPISFKPTTIGRRAQPAFKSHGFVELPPYTGGKWQLPTGFYLNILEWKPRSCCATIEYKTLSRKSEADYCAIQ